MNLLLRCISTCCLISNSVIKITFYKRIEILFRRKCHTKIPRKAAYIMQLHDNFVRGACNMQLYDKMYVCPLRGCETAFKVRLSRCRRNRSVDDDVNANPRSPEEINAVMWHATRPLPFFLASSSTSLSRSTRFSAGFPHLSRSKWNASAPFRGSEIRRKRNKMKKYNWNDNYLPWIRSLRKKTKRENRGFCFCWLIHFDFKFFLNISFFIVLFRIISIRDLYLLFFLNPYIANYIICSESIAVDEYVI